MLKLIVLCFFLLILTVYGCGSEPAVNTNKIGKSVKILQKKRNNPVQDSELKIMTADDMEKFKNDRKNEIERNTPLNEEHDVVEELRKKMLNK